MSYRPFDVLTDTAYWSAYPHDVWWNYSLLQLCDLPFMWLCLCPEIAPHHKAQGGSCVTTISMLTLNVSCSGLHYTESSPPADNRPLGTEHDTQLLVDLVQDLPVLTDRSSTYCEEYIEAYQNKFIWFALMSTAVRASGIRSNATRWLIILWSDFFPCRTVSSSYPFLLLPPGASC